MLRCGMQLASDDILYHGLDESNIIKLVGNCTVWGLFRQPLLLARSLARVCDLYLSHVLSPPPPLSLLVSRKYPPQHGPAFQLGGPFATSPHGRTRMNPRSCACRVQPPCGHCASSSLQGQPKQWRKTSSGTPFCLPGRSVFVHTAAGTYSR